MAMSPFRGRGLFDPRSEVNQVFNEMFGNRTPEQQAVSRQGEWAPAMDVREKDSDLVLTTELPGVRLEDVDITVQEQVLTITGERKEDREEQQDSGYAIRERRRGTFRRSMHLPEGVTEDHIKARFQDGVLEVTLEGAAVSRQPKKIQIEGSESSGS